MFKLDVMILIWKASIPVSNELNIFGVCFSTVRRQFVYEFCSTYKKAPKMLPNKEIQNACIN